MMSENSNLARAIADHLNERYASFQEISVTTDLLEAGILESLAIMDLVTHLERRYGVTFEAEEIAPTNFQSPQALADLVGIKQRQLAGAT